MERQSLELVEIEPLGRHAEALVTTISHVGPAIRHGECTTTDSSRPGAPTPVNATRCGLSLVGTNPAAYTLNSINGTFLTLGTLN